MRRYRGTSIVAAMIIGVSFLVTGTPDQPVTWDLLLNPYAVNSNNLAYVVEVGGAGGTEVFNPFAVPGVRQAINRFVDRRSIRDTILPPGSSIAYSPVRMGMPTIGGIIKTPGGQTFSVCLQDEHSFDVGRIYPGLHVWGSEPLLISAVKAAMSDASKLSCLQKAGKKRLEYVGTAWQFDGKDVEVKVLRRSDTQSVHHKIANHVGLALGACGFTVKYVDGDKMTLPSVAWPKVEANGVMKPDPSKYPDFEWSIYIEGWVSTDEATESIPAVLAAQAYSAAAADPLTSTEVMPSGFKTPLLDDVCLFMDCVFKPLTTSNCGTQSWSWLLTYFASSDELYWDLTTLIVRMGMDNAVRIYLGFQDQ